MTHNEDSRVKIPALLHLTRLGYTYLSLKEIDKSNIDPKTNIFRDLFQESLLRINPTCTPADIEDLYKEVALDLKNEDLGKAFYQKLVDRAGTRLLDLENVHNNSFHVVTELPYKNGEENFRPDIILLINGMPLVFVEVKKPNNKDGILAEKNRMDRRFQNKKLRLFANITQFMIFSNNMEYEENINSPIYGAFYATPSYQEHYFNYFREENIDNWEQGLLPINQEREEFILKDNNLITLKHQTEYHTNKAPSTPTNKILTSLCQKERLAFFLQYSLAYVEKSTGLEKHIMRYPQFFATKAIQKTLDKGLQKGIIWHTQGSGKTALAYYNVQFLTDYFQQKGVLCKFYFIVDRIDLLDQAKREFTARGLQVNTVSSRQEFQKDIQQQSVLHGSSGQLEITVVNIHKFGEDSKAIQQTDYNVNIQRIYFLDEVHRSYNPTGSFLLHLNTSDPKAIKIGLTGTPLIGEHLQSKQLFGNYIHKYYYDKSIADGYTLRLIREEISTKYKLALTEILEKIEVLQGKMKREKLYAHPKFVEGLLDYIVTDFESFRNNQEDDSVGAMVICDSSAQAEEMNKIFQAIYAVPEEEQPSSLSMAAEPRLSYTAQLKKKRQVTSAALILHDVGDKEERKQLVEDFKEGKIDFLFVYNMLLTGFDAPRLKKLYLGRGIKKHNLLQALTRVNRTYKDYKYGYVVDFANIEEEFERTNKAYFEELKEELGSEIEHYATMFMKPEEIEEKLEEVKDILWDFTVEDAELFRLELSKIKDKKQCLAIRKALENAKDFYNLIRQQEHSELLETFDFEKLPYLLRAVKDHINTLNTIEALHNSDDSQDLLNFALEDVIFEFTKLQEHELLVADQLKNQLRKTREALHRNMDKKDPEFVTLYEEMRKLFKSKNLEEITQQEIRENIDLLEKIHQQTEALNQKNERKRNQYQGDEKFVRVHKRAVEQNLPLPERKLCEVLNQVKKQVDEEIAKNSKLLNNESFAQQEISKFLYQAFLQQNKKLQLDNYQQLSNSIIKEYINEYKHIYFND